MKETILINSLKILLFIMILLILLRIFQVIFKIVLFPDVLTFILFYSFYLILALPYFIGFMFKKRLRFLIIFLPYSLILLFTAFTFLFIAGFPKPDVIVYDKKLDNKLVLFVFGRSESFGQIETYPIIVTKFNSFIYRENMRIDKLKIWWNTATDSSEIIIEGKLISFPNPKVLNKRYLEISLK
jgi:hypothetical protein